MYLSLSGKQADPVPGAALQTFIRGAEHSWRHLGLLTGRGGEIQQYTLPRGQPADESDIYFGLALQEGTVIG